MSARLQVPALAMSPALAAIAPGPALAKASQPHIKLTRLRTNRIAMAPTQQRPFRWIRYDRPDARSKPIRIPRIRFEMNRDDRNRRLGGS
jgi:hypothetical protein